MKGKSVTFRPKAEHRKQLDRIAAATERPITWLIEKAIEAYLPVLERRYAEELKKMDAGAKKTGQANSPSELDRELLRIAKAHYPRKRAGGPPGGQQ